MAHYIYCLTKDELLLFIKHLMEGQHNLEPNDALNHVIADWRAWENEIICLSHSFIEILEMYEKSNSNQHTSNVLDTVRSLPTEGYELVLEGYAEEFVDYIFKFFNRDQSLDITEDLSNIRKNYGNYNFRFKAH